MATLSHKELTDLEKGTLIEEVRNRPAIWDSTHENHSKRIIINTLFGEIARFISTTERIFTAQVIKDAWKNLKTSFNGYKRKQQTVAGLSEDDAPKKWKFFDQIAASMIAVPAFDEQEDQITDIASFAEFVSSLDQPNQSQLTVVNSEPSISTPIATQHKTPQSSKKRKNDSSIDDEFAQAIIQSLSTSTTLTPLGRFVSNLESKLEQRNQERLSIDFIQAINSVISDFQNKSLDLLEN